MNLKNNLLYLAVACALSNSLMAVAANTAEAPCATTEQCAAQAAKIGATVDKSKSKVDKTESQFSWLNRINKASIVMLTEEGIVKPQMGNKIAGGVRFAIDQADKPDGKKPTDVLQLEQIMTQKWIHLFGRNFEAFAEWRRNGYPVLTPGSNQGSTGGTIPRRAIYSTREAQLNNVNYQAAVGRLSNGDSFISKVWWDKR